MTKSKRVNRQRALRNANGSILVGVVVLVLGFVAIAAPLLVFLANVSNQLVLQERAANIAQQTAAVVDNYRYWLEAPRPGFDSNRAIRTATEAAKVMCLQSNMKDPTVAITFEHDSDGNDLTVCTLKADASSSLSQANIFGFDMSKYFTGQLLVREANTHTKVPAYSIMRFDAPTVEDQSASRPLGLNRRDVAVLPAYGFFNNMAAGSTNDIATPYGKGVAELNPENYFAMNYYHLKKTDIETVERTGNEDALAGWHPGRVIDGQKVEFR